MGNLHSILRAGNLLVVNDAATLPASLRGLREDGAPFELRLLAHEGHESTRWRAVLFGRGDWRQRTEDRPAPPRLVEGERVRVAGGAVARVLSVETASPRLVRIEFVCDAASMWRAIYRDGRPVQYSYVAGPLALWHVQSSFAARPWAVEPPSAGRPLTFSVLEKLRRQGVAVAVLTHAAGLSSSGDPSLDALLPLDERYDLPAPTVRAMASARALGGASSPWVPRSCVPSRAARRRTTGSSLPERAAPTCDSAPLEASGGERPAHGDPRVGDEPLRPDAKLRVAGLMQPSARLRRARRILQHEFGDSVLILPR